MKKSPLKALTLLTLATAIISCSSDYKYWDVSKFNVDDSLIEDSTEVSIIYSSQGPDLKIKSDNKLQLDQMPLVTQDYFIHLIAQVNNTGDTINILTTMYNDFTQSDQGKAFIFLSKNDLATKLSMASLESLTEIEDLDQLEISTPDKVVRDPKFDFLADNNFPTIIGRVARK